MDIRELIGRNLRQAREADGLTQKELGERVAEVLGKSWLPQAVSLAEKGGRDFAAEDLVAVAWALHRPVSWFLTVPEDASANDVLELPGDAILHLAWVNGEETTELDSAEITRRIGRLLGDLEKAHAREAKR